MLLLGHDVTNLKQRLLLRKLIAHVERYLLRLGTNILGRVAQCVCLTLLGLHVQLIDATSLGHHAILLQLPHHSVGLQTYEEILVIDLNLTRHQIHCIGPYRLILAAHLIGVSLRRAVCGDYTVVVERVIGCVVVIEVATIIERHLAVGLILRQALIDEIPDETTLIVGVLTDQVPILLESTHRVTHRVGILTLDEGLLGRVLHIVLAPLQVSIHRAHNIGKVVTLGTLVMNRA